MGVGRVLSKGRGGGGGVRWFLGSVGRGENKAVISWEADVVVGGKKKFFFSFLSLSPARKVWCQPHPSRRKPVALGRERGERIYETSSSSLVLANSNSLTLVSTKKKSRVLWQHLGWCKM